MVNVAHLESQRFIDENGWESVGFQVINEKALHFPLNMGMFLVPCWFSREYFLKYSGLTLMIIIYHSSGSAF